jgi:hypothetical protein
MKDISKTDYNLKVQTEDNITSLLIESSTRLEDDTKLKVSLLTPESDKGSLELTLKQIAPQRFTAELKDINPNAYTVKISRVKDEKIVDLKTKGLIVPEGAVEKPLESSNHGNNVSLLKHIAEITGGKYNPSEEEMIVEEKETIRVKDLANYLIPLAIILFIFDIAARKFNRQNI